MADTPTPLPINKLMPEYNQKQINQAIMSAGWGSSWIKWRTEKSKFGEFYVSAVSLDRHTFFYLVFDYNSQGARISRFAPSDDDREVESTHHDADFPERIETARKWAAKTHDYYMNRQLIGDAPSGATIVSVKAGKPHTAHVDLAKVFDDLSGEIRVCDPYYGSGSLTKLQLLKKCKPIKFLTQVPDRTEKLTIAKLIQDFCKENPAIEFRLHSPNDLHDRFVLAKDDLIILGHGLKDIGNKDSFVIRLSRDIAGDTIDNVKDVFDSRWNSAPPLR